MDVFILLTQLNTSLGAFQKTFAPPKHRPQVYGITIDGPDSQDLDDAIWVETTSGGGYQIQVHIADVAELVQPASPADTKAIERTQTLYRKNTTRPMLPRPLEAKLSLVEGEPKLTLTIVITLDDQGYITDTQIFESQFTNLKRFSYTDADLTLQDAGQPLHSLLQSAQSVTQLLSRQRQQQGAIGGIAVPGGWLDEEGHLIAEGARYHAHVLIQELMILTNQAVAEWLIARDLPALYRNHCARLVAPEACELLPALLNLGSFAAVRKQLHHWLGQAEYGPTVKGHFALALTAYCHATSPIRRLADLINHRIIKASLRGQPQPYSKQQLHQLGQHIAQVSQSIEDASKKYFQAKAATDLQIQLESPQYFAQLSDEEFSRLLKYAIQAKTFDRLDMELANRIDQGCLSAADLHQLLASEHPAWQRLALDHLQHRLHDATSILSMIGTQEPGWQGIQYFEPENVRQFICWAEIKLAGTILTHANSVTRLRKQLARQAACLVWLSAWVTGELVEPAQRVWPAPQPENLPALDFEEYAEVNLELPTHLASRYSGQPFAADLNHLCQKQGWATPEYVFEPAVNGHFCRCKLTLPTEDIEGVGTAQRKQTAKHLAAWQVLQILQAV